MATAALIALTHCGQDPAAPQPEEHAAFRAFVSDPVSTAAAVEPVPGVRGNAASMVVYVSMPPGAIPGGVSVTIRNLATAFVEPAPLVDGGLDPVPVPAAVGDTLELLARDSVGTVQRVITVVAVRRAPVVVRTDPPPKKTDVPLNPVIIVVFSEPVDPRSVTSETVRLLRGETAVNGALAVSGDRLRVEVRPDGALAPETEYRLVVTAGVTDLVGDPLQAQVDVWFTTTTAVPVASVTVSPDTTTIEFGGTLQLTAVAQDAAGNVLGGRVTSWSSSDTGVAVVSASGLVTGGGPGAAAVTALVEGVSASASVSVRALVFTALSAGGGHTCGLTGRGTALCWGANSQGQLGIGRFDDRSSSPTARPVVGGLVFLSLAAGDQHNCGRTPLVYCWGSDSGWALGQRPSAVGWSPSPLPIMDTLGMPDTRPWAVLAAGTHRSCALSATEDKCWGRYQLAMDEFFFFEGAVPWDVGFRLASVTSGGNHDCGLTPTGRAYCWGVNMVGQRGDGTVGYLDWPDAQRTTPVNGALAFVSLGAGETHTCGLTPTGAAFCWGDDAFGQLGTSEPISCDPYPFPCSPTPVPVRGGLAFMSISAGGRHTCGIATDGAAYCWGDNTTGQLGGTTRSQGLVLVDGGLLFASLSAGRAHTCGLTTDGVAYCWGNNADGQLGDGTRVNRTTPVRVAGQP